jgi:uncharacterized protein (DUF427 family)
MSRDVTPSDLHVHAVWNGEVIADSDRTILVEGNHYFPREDVKSDLLAPSSESSFCPWKGDASYHDLVVGDTTNAGAAWYYAEPYEAAAPIKDYVAFWKGVEVEPVA